MELQGPSLLYSQGPLRTVALDVIPPLQLVSVCVSLKSTQNFSVKLKIMELYKYWEPLALAQSDPEPATA